MRVAAPVVISDEDRKTLERWSRGRSYAARLVLRAKIVLLAASGKLRVIPPNALPRLGAQPLHSAVRGSSPVGNTEIFDGASGEFSVGVEPSFV